VPDSIGTLYNLQGMSTAMINNNAKCGESFEPGTHILHLSSFENSDSGTNHEAD